jgi:hypothetical protein
VNIPFQVKHHFINYAKAKASSFFSFSTFSSHFKHNSIKMDFHHSSFQVFFTLFFVNSTMLCSFSLSFSLHHLNLLGINLNVFVCNANIHIWEHEMYIYVNKIEQSTGRETCRKCENKKSCMKIFLVLWTFSVCIVCSAFVD